MIASKERFVKRLLSIICICCFWMYVHPAHSMSLSAGRTDAIIAYCPQLSQVEIVTVDHDHPKQNYDHSLDLSGAITEKMRRQLWSVETVSSFKQGEHILVYIDSSGGAISNALRMAYALTASPAHYTGFIERAESAAIVIMLGLDEAYGFPDTRIILHALKYEDDAMKKSDLLDDLNERLKRLYQARLNLSEACINALVRPGQDIILNASDALRLGFIDRIILNHQEIIIRKPE